MYADDITLSKSSNWQNAPHPVDALNQDFKCLDEWSARNKMFINTENFKSMLVTGKRLRNFMASSSIGVNLDGSNIKHITDFKPIGVTLDQDFSFNRQVDELCNTLSRRIGLLRHISA